jgi:hypothetical protein
MNVTKKKLNKGRAAEKIVEAYFTQHTNIQRAFFTSHPMGKAVPYTPFGSKWTNKVQLLLFIDLGTR